MDENTVARRGHSRHPVAWTIQALEARCTRNASGCLEWQGATTAGGYGSLRVRNRGVTAHRFAWELRHGPVPDGLFVLHHCDNRPCIADGHLFLGTIKDNAIDAARKGRIAGQRLTADDVRRIRAADVPQDVLVKQYGVCQATISHIQTGRNWRHVT